MTTAAPSNGTADLGDLQSGEGDCNLRNGSVLARLRHLTWAWFMLPMSTGGLALLLSPDVQPHTFHGLRTIGKVVYIVDLAMFACLGCGMIYRFTRWPDTLGKSLTHPTESLFVATLFLSVSNIIAAIAHYGIPACGPWLLVVYQVLFWAYFGVTFCVGLALYMLLFTKPSLQVQDMTPAWDLPIFPFMLSGTIAATGAGFLAPPQAIAMIVAGLTAQGLGFFVSLLMSSLYIRRMIEFGLPTPSARPAMFVAVGPPAFTSLAVIGMANAYPAQYGFFGPGEATFQTLKALATVFSILLWSLSFWFFCIATLACLLVARQMKFRLNWWAFVFPNVGFTIATITIGKQLQSAAVLWLGSVVTILIVVLYLFLAYLNVQAVLRKRILFHGRDEDVYEQQSRPKQGIRGEKEL